MDDNNKVLIVDDDEAVLCSLEKVVQAAGMSCDIVKSGIESLNNVKKNRYDLILMDINMKGMDGFETIKKLREQKINIPVIIVSGRKEDFDTLYGLDIGADDYVTKPFNPVTLGAKMKALIRRSKSAESETDQIIKAGPFSYNTSTLRFYKNGEEILLTSKENSMMKLFMDNVNRIFTKDVIYDMVWNNSIIDDNAIMVYINRLRQKIEDDPAKPKYIQNIRGLGYRFVVND